jgi:hypothetical protein
MRGVDEPCVNFKVIELYPPTTYICVTTNNFFLQGLRFRKILKWQNSGNMHISGRCDRSGFCFYFLLLILGVFCVAYPTTASTGTPSFSEWLDTTERAFTNFQKQEDKLLGADIDLTWEKGLRTTVGPEESVIEAERKRDPKAVATVEACHKALLLGAVLQLKALGRLPPGHNNALNIDGDIPFDRYARDYIGLAETCEEGLHLSHPANAFRARYR